MEVKHQYLSNLQQNQLGFFALQVALGQIMVVHNQTEKVLALLECLAIPDSSFRVSLALQIVITKMNNPQADHRWEVQRLYNSRDQHVKHTDIQHAISCEKLQVPQESQEILIQEHNLPSRKTSSNQQSGDNVGRQSAYIFSTNSHHVPSDSTPCARQTNHNYNFETFFNSLQSSIERKVTRTGSSMTSSQQPDSAKNDDSGNVDNNNTQRPFGLGLGLLSNFVNNSTQFPFESGLGLRNSIANKSIQPLFELRGGTRNCLPDFKCGNGRKSGFDWGEPYIEKLVEPKPKEPGFRERRQRISSKWSVCSGYSSCERLYCSRHSPSEQSCWRGLENIMHSHITASQPNRWVSASPRTWAYERSYAMPRTRLRL